MTAATTAAMTGATAAMTAKMTAVTGGMIARTAVPDRDCCGASAKTLDAGERARGSRSSDGAERAG